MSKLKRVPMPSQAQALQQLSVQDSPGAHQVAPEAEAEGQGQGRQVAGARQGKGQADAQESSNMPLAADDAA